MPVMQCPVEVNYQLKKHGALTDSFVTAFYNMGKNYPFDFTNREEVNQLPLEPPVSISFDFGAAYEGYCYDFGRSVFFGTPEIAVPTLVVAGSHDALTPLKYASFLRDHITDAEMTVIEGSGHLMAAEQPDAFCHALAQFLAK